MVKWLCWPTTRQLSLLSSPLAQINLMLAFCLSIPTHIAEVALYSVSPVIQKYSFQYSSSLSYMTKVAHHSAQCIKDQQHGEQVVHARAYRCALPLLWFARMSPRLLHLLISHLKLVASIWTSIDIACFSFAAMFFLPLFFAATQVLELRLLSRRLSLLSTFTHQCVLFEFLRFQH